MHRKLHNWWYLCYTRSDFLRIFLNFAPWVLIWLRQRSALNDGQDLATAEYYPMSSQTFSHSGPKGWMSINEVHQSLLGGQSWQIASSKVPSTLGWATATNYREWIRQMVLFCGWKIWYDEKDIWGFLPCHSRQSFSLFFPYTNTFIKVYRMCWQISAYMYLE